MQYINLNVGGRAFSLSKRTIDRYPNSLLAMMLACKDMKPSHLKEDAFWIERNPDNFRIVMNYYMEMVELGLPESVPELKNLREDAEFYALPELVEFIDRKINNLESISERQKEQTYYAVLPKPTKTKRSRSRPRQRSRSKPRSRS